MRLDWCLASLADSSEVAQVFRVVSSRKVEVKVEVKVKVKKKVKGDTLRAEEDEHWRPERRPNGRGTPGDRRTHKRTHLTQRREAVWPVLRLLRLSLWPERKVLPSSCANSIRTLKSFPMDTNRQTDRQTDKQAAGDEH